LSEEIERGDRGRWTVYFLFLLILLLLFIGYHERAGEAAAAEAGVGENDTGQGCVRVGTPLQNAPLV